MGVKQTPFWDRVNKTERCWLWTGAIWGNNSYGCTRFNGKCQQAHRVSWQLINGPISPGMQILHHCDTPLCVRPDHLFLGTPHTNSLDAVAKGRKSNGNRGKKYCKRGHEFTLENTRLDGKGRQCKICDEIRPSKLNSKKRVEMRVTLTHSEVKYLIELMEHMNQESVPKNLYIKLCNLENKLLKELAVA